VSTGAGIDLVLAHVSDVDGDVISDFASGDILRISGVTDWVIETEYNGSEHEVTLAHTNETATIILSGDGGANDLYLASFGDILEVSLDETAPIELTDQSDRFITETANPHSVVANGGDDFVLGGYGAAILLGGMGSDNLIGRGSDDVLAGGAGNDVLTGGNGANQFVMDAEDFASFSVDTITDFTVGKDSLVLNGATGTLTSLGADAAVLFGAGLVHLENITLDEVSLNDIVDATGGSVTSTFTSDFLTLTDSNDRVVLGASSLSPVYALEGDDFVLGGPVTDQAGGISWARCRSGEGRSASR